MTKEEKEKKLSDAVHKMVEREFHPVPQEWVRIVMESEGENHALPMWNTMWFVDKFVWDRLYDASKVADGKEDEEMEGERRLKKCSNVYLYEIGDEYLVGIHGAGFSFYDYIWPAIYKTLGLEWHLY